MAALVLVQSWQLSLLLHFNESQVNTNEQDSGYGSMRMEKKVAAASPGGFEFFIWGGASFVRFYCGDLCSNMLSFLEKHRLLSCIPVFKLFSVGGRVLGDLSSISLFSILGGHSSYTNK